MDVDVHKNTLGMRPVHTAKVYKASKQVTKSKQTTQSHLITTTYIMSMASRSTGARRFLLIRAMVS